MTATATPKPSVEMTQEIFESALERIAGTSDFLEFEQAWIEGLRSMHGSSDRDARSRILAGAGRRLGAFGDSEDDIARRHWLRQVVEEVQLHGDTPLDGELAAVATEELREAFARASPKIADLRAALAAGESLQEFAIRCPVVADQVRDLGRIAEGLRGTSLLALCSKEDSDLARDLARAMQPPVHLAPTVPESLRVTREDLLRWAQTSCAPTEFPRLVRSLIAETEPSGRSTAGIHLLDSWWGNWLAATTSPLNEGIVLAGREKAAADLRERCRQNSGTITVGGQFHRDEIIAFVAASLTAEDVEQADPKPVLFVDNHDTAQQLFAHEALATQANQQAKGPAMTMVVPSVEFAKHLPAGSPHRMIVPVPGNGQAAIVLGPVDSELVCRHFEETGEELHRAYKLGGLARISLTALRRRLSVEPALHTPDWATGAVDPTLRRSLLLGGWNEAREGDREIVERFVGRPHEEVTEALRQLDAGDSPMTATGDLWHAVSPADTWTLLHNQLCHSDSESFVAIALDVLTAPDPLLELTRQEALSAQINGVRCKYSSQLRHGIATTLALGGTSPPTLHGDPNTTTSFAEAVTRQALRSATEDATPSTWIAIADTLPLLAEAAPEAVLEGLRTCVNEQHAFAEAMFSDHGDRFFEFSGPSPHVQVLNALEVISWSPDYLLAATDVLARLACVDPGGRYTNRPQNSLASIMCPWMPYTSAAAEDRLEAVKMLRRSHPGVAWPLMLSMLPRNHSVQTSGNPPRYRDWRPTQPVVMHSEYAQTTAAIAAMLVDDVGEDANRWIDLIGQISYLPEEIRHRAVSALGDLAMAGADETYKSKVWPVLREFVARHRKFYDAEWALPATELAPFEQAMDALRPAEPSVAYGYLFSNSLLYLDGVSATDGDEAFQQALKPKQTETVDAVFVGGGLSAVFKFAAAVDQQRRVGSALAVCHPNLDGEILAAMESAPEAVTHVSLGYFGQRFASLGWDGLTQLLEKHELSPQVFADVLRAPPSFASAWERVAGYGTAVAAEYWSRVSYFDLGIPEDLEQLLEVCRQLRGAGRLGLARTILAPRASDYASSPELAEEAAALLELWIEHSGEEIEHHDMTRWELASLFKVLDAHDDHLGTARTAVLEWRYLPILHHDPEFTSPNLYREMLRDPDLFVQFVEMAFKPANSPPDEQPTSAAHQQLVLSAIDVLRNWPSSQFAPRIDADGNLDTASLNEWTDRTREKLAAIDRADIGDQMIGTALASSPADSNGEWPGEAVRDLLERLQSNQVDKGFYIAVLNQRGVTTRSPTDGGEQERRLAETYKAQSRRYQRWPRTAAIFSHLADSYAREAGFHDREAETFRRGLPGG